MQMRYNIIAWSTSVEYQAVTNANYYYSYTLQHTKVLEATMKQVFADYLVWREPDSWALSDSSHLSTIDSNVIKNIYTRR